MRRNFTVVLSVWCCLSGCQRQEPSQPSAAVPPVREAPVRLNVLVVNDPALAEGASLLRGEWAQRSGGELVVSQGTIEQLLESVQLPADLVIYPARYVGELVDRQLIRPVRPAVLQNADYAYSDLLPLIRNRLLPFGDQIFALPLGDPPLMLAWRSDLSSEGLAGGERTWSDVKITAPAQSAGLLPLDYASAIELLARARANTQLESGEALCFDPDTMQPRITELPFQRALTELINSRAEEVGGDVDQQATLGWPTMRSQPEPGSTPVQLHYSLLPRSRESYDRSRQRWVANREGQPLALVGIAGRSASVTRSSRNAASAFKLLRWIASGDVASQLSGQSDATCWFRQSQSRKLEPWRSGREFDDRTSQTVTELLSRDDYFLLPRIPQIDAYLQVLDNAVQQATAGPLSVEQALQEAAQQWIQLTDQYGPKRLRTAYRQHLGLGK